MSAWNDDDDFELVQDLLHQKHPDRHPPSACTYARNAAAALSGDDPNAKSGHAQPPQTPPSQGARRNGRSSPLLFLVGFGWIIAFAACQSLGLQFLWQGDTGGAIALWAGCAALIALPAAPLIRALRGGQAHSGGNSHDGSGPPPEP